MKLNPTLSDAAVLAELGRRLTQQRVQQTLTQADLAREAGVSKRTVERLEAGTSVQLTNLLRVLRRLDLLDALDTLLPPAAPGPMDLLRKREAPRQRVRPASRRDDPAKASRKGWQWDEDK